MVQVFDHSFLQIYSLTVRYFPLDCIENLDGLFHVYRYPYALYEMKADNGSNRSCLLTDNQLMNDRAFRIPVLVYWQDYRVGGIWLNGINPRGIKRYLIRIAYFSQACPNGGDGKHNIGGSERYVGILQQMTLRFRNSFGHRSNRILTSNVIRSRSLASFVERFVPLKPCILSFEREVSPESVSRRNEVGYISSHRRLYSSCLISHDRRRLCLAWRLP